mgnify:FL=1|jgi:S-adenosyl-methyltransferase mraW
MEELHISVLLKEAIEELKLRDNSIIVDATLGYGGHSSNILDRIKKGFLFAFDQDSEAINYSTNRLKPIGANFTIIKNNFVNLKKELNDRKIDKVDGILFDLGVSSPELDEDYRGFSYHKDAYLDMRMDQEAKLTAHDVVNKYDINKLTDIFRRYGEDKFARNIAKKIVEAREIKEIDTTLELVEIIKTAVPMKFRIAKHPARQIFQAIRIEVNHELDVLEPALKDALSMLSVGGRLVVITFHSLEDRIVKHLFKEVSKIPDVVKGMPNIPEEYLPDYKEIASISPTKEEIEKNPRARSARMRVIERIK